MAPVSDKQRHDAIMAAVAAVTCTLLFAVIFIGMIFIIVNSSPKNTTSNITITAEMDPEPFNVLLIGSDSREGTMLYNSKAKEYAESITLMHVEPATLTITLVTVPGDSVITAKSKIVSSSLNSGKAEDVVSTVEELTGAHIDYYAMTTFLQFSKLVNGLGGVDVDVPVTVSGDNPTNGKKVTVKAGDDQHLNGAQALTLARASDEYKSDADAHRQENIRRLIIALLRNAFELDNIDDFKDALEALEKNVETNVDIGAMSGTMLAFIADSENVTIYECTGPYKLQKRNSDNLQVVQPDPKAWAEILEIIDFGEDPSTVIQVPELNQ